MNLQRMGAVALKEWREIVRDRLFFSLAFIVPIALMLMFGFGLSLDVENSPMAIGEASPSTARTATRRDTHRASRISSTSAQTCNSGTGSAWRHRVRVP